MGILATLSIVCGLLSLFCLTLLHVVSPEFKPGWRMISEYALGKHKGWITSFFILWGTSSALLSLLLWNVVTSPWAMMGVFLLLLSAIGELMGGLFDVKHKWHGLSFMLGVPSLPIAALLIGHSESWGGYSTLILIVSHSTWISMVAMAATMGILFSGLKKAGITMDKNSEPLERIPEGVIAINGYANRLLVLCYIAWLMVMAGIYLIL